MGYCVPYPDEQDVTEADREAYWREMHPDCEHCGYTVCVDPHCTCTDPAPVMFEGLGFCGAGCLAEWKEAA